MKKIPSRKLIAFLSFTILLCIGFRLASQKPLWNDEIYSQIASVENLSPLQMVMGHIGEGNACPLFYLSQKFICSISQYHSPVEWQKGTSAWDFDRPLDRIVLRIGPVVMTALAMSLIFYFFSQSYSWTTAGLSLFLSLSSGMLWQYWAEARPYSLWMLLTAIQVILFLRIQSEEKQNVKLLNTLAVVHVLLSLTVVLSLPQILLVTCLLWLYGIRDPKGFVFLLIVPTAIALIYFFISPHYPFGLIFSVEQYLRANISRDRLYVMCLFGLSVGLCQIFPKLRESWIGNVIKEGLPALWMFLGMIISALGILLLFKLKQGPIVQFPVTEKYFIFLTPVGIIAVTIFVDRLMSSAKNFWMSSLLLCGIAALVLPRFLKVISELLKQYPHLLS